MKLFHVYEIVAPLALGPAAYFLWLSWSHQDHRLVLLAMGIPILFGYVIPAIGTNVLGLWAVRSRLTVGRFRPHHGFVFGSASSLIAVLILDPVASGPLALDVARAAIVMGSTLAFWNWAYDIYAIKVGFIEVYNQPYSKGRGPAAIATDYAPVLFGVFGACYGAAIRIGQHVLADPNHAAAFGWLVAVSAVSALGLPVLAFVFHTYLRRGESGLRPHGGPQA